MRYIKKFGDNQPINESVIELHDDFYQILGIIDRLGGSPIAAALLSLIHKGVEVKLSLNFLKPGGSDTEILGFQDSQYQRFRSEKGDREPNQKSTISKSVISLLTSNGFEFSAREINDFLDKWREAYDEFHRKNDSDVLESEGKRFRLVKGEHIRIYYGYETYSRDGSSDNDILNLSELRKPNYASHLDIFVKNPDSCQMLILYNEDGTIDGRSLIWKLSSSSVSGATHFQDRIYFINNRTKRAFKKWAENRNMILDSGRGVPATSLDSVLWSTRIEENNPNLIFMNVELSYIPEKFPWMDTFKYLDGSNNTLSNFIISDRPSEFYKSKYRITGPHGGLNPVSK